MAEVIVPEDFFSAPLPRIPAIIEAWFFSSDRMRQFGSSRPIVPSAASFDT
jgi:hypothetical protein